MFSSLLVYTIFALCEYFVVASNIAFHATAALDFGHGHLLFALPSEDDISKIK